MANFIQMVINMGLTDLTSNPFIDRRKNHYISCFHTSFYEVEPILLRCRVKIFKEKEKFIEMRAQGISFAKISKEINVSKPILIEWNREFEKEIAHRQF